ncbi:hypothetical protein [Methylocella sp. CPCC 101449]|uniref:hypothetical protein n=1 Tax=Methylocella sp. CPCC 101449 TaxID=2987531 RepID=UPI00288F2385|nr:hypothetical protein [Methylocella sp. CPCC 101449]MDT2023036.1 hypothetical protein [Methylocella sp. CPCC 101449]
MRGELRFLLGTAEIQSEVPMKEECASCRFWRRFRENDADGSCRRRSPQPSSLVAEHIADMLGHISVAQYAAAGTNTDELDDYYPAPSESSYQAQWPSVHQSDWCGDFEIAPLNAA